MNYFVYIAQCRDRTFYTGYTTNINKRCDTHNKGKGSKYTRTRIPIKIVYWEQYNSKSEAMKREYQIKQLTHIQKYNLIKRNSKMFDETK